jgi:hypothetical protein
LEKNLKRKGFVSKAEPFFPLRRGKTQEGITFEKEKLGRLQGKNNFDEFRHDI